MFYIRYNRRKYTIKHFLIQNINQRFFFAVFPHKYKIVLLGKCIDKKSFKSIYFNLPSTYIILIIVKSTQSTSGNSSIHLFFILILKHKEFSDFPHITIYIKSYVLEYILLTFMYKYKHLSFLF